MGTCVHLCPLGAFVVIDDRDSCPSAILPIRVIMNGWSKTQLESSPFELAQKEAEKELFPSVAGVDSSQRLGNGCGLPGQLLFVTRVFPGRVFALTSHRSPLGASEGYLCAEEDMGQCLGAVLAQILAFAPCATFWKSRDLSELRFLHL